MTKDVELIPHRKPMDRHRNRAEYDLEAFLLHIFLRENPDTELRCTECGLTRHVGPPPLLVWMTGRLVCYNCECKLSHAFEDAFARYLPCSTATPATPPENPGVSPDAEPQHGRDDVAVQPGGYGAYRSPLREGRRANVLPRGGRSVIVRLLRKCWRG